MEWILRCPGKYFGQGVQDQEAKYRYNISEDREALLMPGRGPWAQRVPESEAERKRRGRRTVSQARQPKAEQDD